ncbi:hypothetical protein EDD21DRAFT_366358 [Dissophora ornata]|nr:hypothetical protein EDD21DRAFT_366358 [Dissophora ornata]
MNTEYLDAVDKELFDIEDFFKDIHNPTANSAINIHPRLLPFLKFGAYSPSADESAATRSTASLASTKVEDMASERFLVDLKERYKHLKLVQDQHRIDLARLQISLRFWYWIGGLLIALMVPLCMTLWLRPSAQYSPAELHLRPTVTMTSVAFTTTTITATSTATLTATRIATSTTTSTATRIKYQTATTTITKTRTAPQIVIMTSTTTTTRTAITTTTIPTAAKTFDLLIPNKYIPENVKKEMAGKIVVGDLAHLTCMEGDNTLPLPTSDTNIMANVLVLGTIIFFLGRCCGGDDRRYR